MMLLMMIILLWTTMIYPSIIYRSVPQFCLNIQSSSVDFLNVQSSSVYFLNVLPSSVDLLKCLVVQCRFAVCGKGLIYTCIYIFHYSIYYRSTYSIIAYNLNQHIQLQHMIQIYIHNYSMLYRFTYYKIAYNVTLHIPLQHTIQIYIFYYSISYISTYSIFSI